MKFQIKCSFAMLLAVGLAGVLHAQTLTDLGTSAPTPGTNDICQFSTNGNTAWPNFPDGINYYTDNNPPAGQTFTTGTNAMNLVSVAIRTAGLNSGNGYGTPSNTPTYYLSIYSMIGSTATLLVTVSAPNPGFTDGDWLQWSGLSVSLATNATYAYAFGIKPGSGGYAALAVATNAYAGGEMALIPTNGGAITTGSSHTYDAVFDLGLQPAGTNILTDTGTANPVFGPNDISQLSTNGNAHLTGTFNYFTDNGNPPGQTFTTGTKPVVLGSLSLRTGSAPLDANAAGLGPQAYQLQIFSVSGTNATLLTTYTSQSTFSYTDGDWLRWANLAVPLAANATYAYNFHRVSSGYGGLAVASGNLYAGGAAALIPSGGGAITFESSGTYDGVFVVGLSTNASHLLVGTPVVSPGTAYIGDPITVSSAAVGNLPISYQWQSGGASGSLTNVPTATNATLIVTPPNTGTYRYDYIATDSSGSITSGVATATIIVGTPSISPSNTVYLGSPITLTSPSGAGNPPLGYQWQSAGASGSLTNVPNASNVSFTVTPPGTGTFRYDYILTNDFGSFTSSVVTVTVLAPITVTLNTTQTMATMPLEGLGVASAVYDNILTSAGTGNSISNAGINIIRYPGGSYADCFHWQNYSGCDNIYLASGNTFDNWINNTVIPAGAKAIITVNYGSNTTCDGGADPSEAAAWVDYANNTRKLGIKYWEIGNEQGGNGYYGGSGWEYDLHYPYDGNRNLQPALSPAAYGSNSLVIINAMKAKDSTIKCGIGFDQGRVSYNAAALPPVSNVVDFVVIHWYPGGTDAQQLQSPLQIAAGVSDCRSQIGQYVGSRSNLVGIAVTETGSGVLGGGSAEYAADTLLTWIENGACNVDYQELHSGFLASGTPGIANNSLMGPAYGAKMARLLAAVGDTMLNITSSTTAVHVHATTRQDGKTGIMLINTDPLIPIAVTVNISGPALASSGIWYQFGQTNFIGTNSYPSFPISSNNVSGLGNTFTVTVPAYTVVNLLIPAAPTNTPPVLAAITNQTVNVAQTVAFTASATDTDQPPQTLTFSLLAGPGTATLNAGSGAFSWTPQPSDAGMTNLFTIKVADNGSPSLSATQSFSVMVNKQTPVLTAPVATAITYGQTLASSGLSGGAATNSVNNAAVAGGFAFTSPATAPSTGTASQSVTFTPTDTAHYNSATVSVNVTVNKRTPVLTAPVATAITYGQTLTNSSLSGGAATNSANNASVAGGFAFTTPATVPVAGTASQSVTFTPTDTTDYNTATVSVSVTVNQASPAFTLSSSKNPSGYTESVIFTASLPTNALGTVNFLTNGVLFDTRTLSGGLATATNSTLPNGTNLIIAIYSGDSNYLGRTNALNQIVTNTPPVLAAISNQTVNVGQTVAFTASATDADSSQTLTFALLAGATNATLNTNSGAFSFRPLVTQANSTNNFTLQVSDNGIPSLSATQSFSVTVNPLAQPGIGNISTAGGQFSFNVSGQSGPDYAIETSTNLTQWSNVFITNSPVLPFTWTDTVTNSPQRFYRIKLGPPLP